MSEWVWSLSCSSYPGVNLLYFAGGGKSYMKKDSSLSRTEVPDLDDLGMPATDDPDGRLMNGNDELVYGL